MKTISKSWTRNTSCSENIVPWISIEARGCCMHVFLVIYLPRNKSQPKHDSERKKRGHSSHSVIMGRVALVGFRACSEPNVV